jgi:predicted Zn-dependent protease
MLTRGTRRGIALLGLLAMGLAAGGCTTNPATGKSEFIVIPESQEIAMGREAAPQFEKEFGGRVPNEVLQSYVQGIGQRIAGVADRKMEYDYTLVSSNVPNAFALPGGQIFITAGLMSRMDNERQLAAVLGHETGHVCALHNVKGMQRQMGTAVLVEVAGHVVGGGDTTKDAAKIVGTMVNLRYSRGDEYQADMLGIRYMTRAGYNPWGMVGLLDVLYSLSESEPGSLAELFQTHPVTSKRIAEAKEIIAAEHPKARQDQPDPQAARFVKMRALLLKVVPNARSR